MTIVVTGAAGFIGYHVCKALLERGEYVIGIDNVNDYYDVKLKKARLSMLNENKSFVFKKIDITNQKKIANAIPLDTKQIIHLAAQAGVRYSIENPRAYIESNILGHFNILETARYLPKLKHLVYASSSSVYGEHSETPFSLDSKIAKPVSLYAATKRSDELISYTYSHLYNIPQTGLRFFTVYGPWGRPDMAYFSFTDSIYKRKPIRLYNYGDMKRDFTYIDDVVDGVLAALDTPPTDKHKIYNLGNHKSEQLITLVNLIEQETGRSAKTHLVSMQPGDVKETFADISESQKDLGYSPNISINEGIPKFIEWYKEYYRI